jgi:CubicO group peptidase (beta-lactamase class C family)
MSTPTLSRRALITNAFRVAASAAIGLPAFDSLTQAQYSPPWQQRAGAAQLRGGFQQQFRVPAMSAAISKNGSFVYDRAGGMADRQHMMQAQQDSLFRIASLSKPITAVAIFSLIEQGKISLTDKVFGSSGVLDLKYGKPPYTQYVAAITVDNLLSHTAGGWPDDANDPMFRNNGWDQEKLISETIANVPLTSAPGTQFIYSNFGYCILGRVIEQVTVQPYASWVQANILAPCGISTMQIAANKEHERASTEVVYIGQYSEDPYKINVRRMDSTQGWIASSTQLVQFLNHVAGAPGIPAILKPETVAIMTTPVSVIPAGSPLYARGWMIDGQGSWWHNGSLPGSTSLMVRTLNGACWAALCNTRTQPHDEMDSALQTMMFELALRK